MREARHDTVRESARLTPVLTPPDILRTVPFRSVLFCSGQVRSYGAGGLPAPPVRGPVVARGLTLLQSTSAGI